jgi:hypothetical protein
LILILTCTPFAMIVLCLKVRRNRPITSITNENYRENYRENDNWNSIPLSQFDPSLSSNPIIRSKPIIQSSISMPVPYMTPERVIKYMAHNEAIQIRDSRIEYDL